MDNNDLIPTGSDDFSVINSEAELEELLARQGIVDDDDDDKENNKDDDDPLKLEQDKTKSKVQPDQNKGKDNDDDDDNDTNQDEVYDNVIQYLDKKHELGLNVKELPKDMTREDEAELVSQLFEQVVTNAENRLRQYEKIEALLEDKEVAALIQAKSEGKGLKDLFSAYSQSAEGMSDEELVFDDLKKRYPKLSEAAINNMIAAQKEKNQFSEIAAAIREQRKEEEAQSIAQREENERKAKELEEQQYAREVEQFTGLVKKVAKINEVTFTEDMKSEVLEFAIKRDKEGLTQLDRALQSDVGVLRATLGIIMLEKLMSANTSKIKNQGKRNLYERLMTKPGEGTGSETRSQDDLPDSIFNQW
jgi:hypothetical protein